MTAMRNRPVWLRTLLLLLAVVQLTVSGAAAVADARLGERSAGPAHVESHSTSACARIHPPDCAFHRFLTAPLVQAPATVLRLREGQGIRWTPLVSSEAQAQSDGSLPASRAPPTHS
jgi:hypothetical protein